jgi:hypothetical protein
VNGREAVGILVIGLLLGSGLTYAVVGSSSSHNSSVSKTASQTSTSMENGTIVGVPIDCNTLTPVAKNNDLTLTLYISSYTIKTGGTECISATLGSDAGVTLTANASNSNSSSLSFAVVNPFGDNAYPPSTCVLFYHPALGPPLTSQGFRCSYYWDTEEPVVIQPQSYQVIVTGYLGGESISTRVNVTVTSSG